MATTTRKIRLMTMNRRSQLIRVNHDVREEYEVVEVVARGRLKIRQMNLRLKQMIRRNLLSHQMTVNHRMTGNLLNRVMQLRGGLCVLHVNRKIHLTLSRRKMHKIHPSYRVNRKIRRTDQLQIRFRTPSFQPKHPNMRNEQTSLQTSHLFNVYPQSHADNASRKDRAGCNDREECGGCQMKWLG